MARLELKLKYQNDDFGMPFSDGSYGIRKDIKTYEMLVDGVPTINLTVEYERFSSKKPNYACAYVSYDNVFFLSNNPNYLNKGYATTALDQITEYLLKEGQVPKVSLNITKDNARSLRVAEKVGFKYIRNDEYSVYHPDALKMIEDGLQYLKELDEDLYDLQMYSWLSSYRKYIEECTPKETQAKGK